MSLYTSRVTLDLYRSGGYEYLKEYLEICWKEDIDSFQFQRQTVTFNTLVPATVSIPAGLKNV